MRFARLKFIIALSLLAVGLNACDAEPRKVTGLKSPESVLQAPDGRIFVSEINKFGKDGDGQISVIDARGKLATFAVGMDDPKGLAMIGDDLYVADKTRILKVAPDGSWKVFVAAEAFPRPPQFLNDLAGDPQGRTLYVSDSGDLEKDGAIYRIGLDGKVTTVIDARQDARVRAPNGLLVDDGGEVLLFVDFATGVLHRLDMHGGALSELAAGFGGADGLARRADRLIYVSDWKNGKVYSVLHDAPKLVKDGFQAAADITLSADGKYILVPDMKAGALVWLPVD